MRETKFIEQNREKWKNFEGVLNKSEQDPDKLNDLFVQVTDDLSYARTFYPNRSIRVYLNQMAQQIFHQIYKLKRVKPAQFMDFWTDELPFLVYQAKNAFLLSFFIFWICFGIGWVSTSLDPNFPSEILGEDYVEMTKENIKNGDPMAVYKQQSETSMSLGIAANNLRVAFLTFVLGVFFAVGTLAIMLYNGIMVGAFQHLFLQEGVFWESFLTIWTHGTLEISAIIIAGAAGLTMGGGLLFPETYSRLQAFLISARRGLKIMIGIAPIIVLAALIEGFLTRYTSTPDLVRLLFILLCLFFVLAYFVWYPFFYKPKVGFKQIPDDGLRLLSHGVEQVKYNTIKSTSDIFTDTFIIYRHGFTQLLSKVVGISFLYVLALALLQSDLSNHFHFTRSIWTFLAHIKSYLGQFFDFWKTPILFVLNVGFFSTLALFVSRQVLQLISGEEAVEKKETFGKVVSILLIIVFLQTLFFTDLTSNFLVIFLAIPFVSVWIYVAYSTNGNLASALIKSFRAINQAKITHFSLSVLLFLIGLVFITAVFSPLSWLYYEIIVWNIPAGLPQLEWITTMLLTFLLWVAFGLTFPLFIISAALFLASVTELTEALQLKRDMTQFGKQKRIKGLDFE